MKDVCSLGMSSKKKIRSINSTNTFKANPNIIDKLQMDANLSDQLILDLKDTGFKQKLLEMSLAN